MAQSEILPYKAARAAEPFTGRYNRTVINRVFREADESNLWPINGRFSATERGIKRVQRFMNEGGYDLQGLEYSLALDSEISAIVNSQL